VGFFGGLSLPNNTHYLSFFVENLSSYTKNNDNESGFGLALLNNLGII
jgi:hypothetical protein